MTEHNLTSSTQDAALNSVPRSSSRKTVRFALFLTATKFIFDLWGDVLTGWVKQLFPKPPPAAFLVVFFLLLIIGIVIVDEGIMVRLPVLKKNRLKPTSEPSAPSPLSTTGVIETNTVADGVPLTPPTSGTAIDARTIPQVNARKIKYHPATEAINLVRILLFDPRSWRNLVNEINPLLSGDFALVDLSRSDWQSRRLRQVLVSGFVIWPLILAVLGSVFRLLTGDAAETYPARLMFGILGLTVGAIFSLSYSIAGSVSGGILFGIMMETTVIIFPIIYKTAIPVTNISLISWLAEGVVLGIPAAVIARNLAEDRNQGETRPDQASVKSLYASSPSFWKQVSQKGWQGVRHGLLILLFVLKGIAAILGTLGFPALLAVILYMVTGKPIESESSGNLFFLASILGSAFGIAIGYSVYHRTGRWVRGVNAGILYGILGTLIFWLQTIDSTLNQDPTLARILNTTLRGMMYGCTFALSYVLSRRKQYPWVGPIASSIVAGLVEVFVFARTNNSFYSKANLALLSGILLGSMIPFVGPSLGRPVRAFRQRVRNFRIRRSGTKLTTNQCDPEVEPLVIFLEEIQDLSQMVAMNKSFPDVEKDEPLRYLFQRFLNCSEDVVEALKLSETVERRMLLRGVEDRLAVLAEDLAPERARYPLPVCERLRAVAEKWLDLIHKEITS